MSKRGLITIFTAFVFWASALFIVLGNDGSNNTKEDNNKSINESTIIDIDKEIEYTGLTDNMELLNDNKLIDFKAKLEESRKIVAEIKRLHQEKIANEKRIKEEKRLAAERAEAERVAEAIAEEARQVELARVAEEKRLADLEAQRVAKNKEKEEAKKNGTEEVVVSRGEQNSNFTEAYYEITAYTAGVESTGKGKDHPNYGLTASGAYVAANVTIACPREIAFGTKIEIEGYGVRVCQDRGSHIVSGRLDIYMENLQDALNFGRRTLKIKIYN